VRSRTSVIDSNVLYSIELSDLFVTFAKRRLIQLRWSITIFDEVRRSLSKSARLSPAAIEYRISEMQRALCDAMHVPAANESLYVRVPPSDRHVLALAVATGADSIITLNTRDFPIDYCSSLGVSVLSPDTVLTEVLIEDLLGVNLALQEISMRRRAPSLSVLELLDRWAQSLPTFVELAREMVDD
jgi:predicted nucleic acid-binding protein